MFIQVKNKHACCAFASVCNCKNTFYFSIQMTFKIFVSTVEIHKKNFLQNLKTRNVPIPSSSTRKYNTMACNPKQYYQSH